LGRDPTVKLWDPVTGRRIAGFHDRPRHHRLITFGPDARTLITVGQDRVVRIQDASDGNQIAEFRSPGDGTIYCTAFRPDGRQAATRNPDGTVTVWDTGTGRSIRTLSGHTAPVVGLAYRPDGRVLASASAPADPASDHYNPGGEVKLWDLETGREIRTLRRGVGVFQVLAFSPDGRRLALAEGGPFTKSGEVLVWDVPTGQDVFILRGLSSIVLDLAFSPDGRRLASGSHDRTIKLWDMDTGDEVLTLRGHTAGIRSLAFSPDGRRLASGGIDWTARIWDASPLVEERRPRSK
jgi:WD40 repeat protein